MLDPADRLGVGPLHVFEHDDRRLAVGHLNDEVGHRQPELVAGAARIEPLGERFVGDEARQELAGLALSALLGGIERGRERVERAARDLERGALGHAEQRSARRRRRARAGGRGRTTRCARPRSWAARRGRRCEPELRGRAGSCRCRERRTPSRPPVCSRRRTARKPRRSARAPPRARRTARRPSPRRVCP